MLSQKTAILVKLSKKKSKLLEALKQLNGFGKKKIEKYGKEITGIIAESVIILLSIISSGGYQFIV